MPIIPDEARVALRERFAKSLRRDVTIKLFGESPVLSTLTIPGRPENSMAQVAHTLAEELADLSPKIKLEFHDFYGAGAEAARELGIDRVPAFVLGEDNAGRLRFYGTPVGNEFAAIIETVEALSQDEPRLSPAMLASIQKLIQEPVHIQVFVTPT